MKNNRRGITETFVSRGLTVTGDTPENESLLQEFYDLRSCIEHVKEILPVASKPRGMSREEAFAYRALQAELLAGVIYSRILTNTALSHRLRTESFVEAFWRRTLPNRRKLWGETVDLPAMADREFHSISPPDIL